MAIARDFVDYGMHPPLVRWPNGARIAVQIVVNYEEGATHPRMMTIGLHCRVGGRPAIARVVHDFLTYTKQFSDVWFARRIDIARWWLEHEGS